ncbi:NAD(P)-binding protein [Myxococcota bacterium]|nr:NAD(P)-binding protein [Myxococcota bacterium]
MRSIAVIGSGITGLATAHGLVRAGFEVTVYSDRTPDQWLNESRPTGTAARFEPALAFERELGLNHWEDVAPKGRGVHLTFCPQRGNRLLTLTGRLDASYFQAVDVRLQSHRWMADLEARGGKIVLENVTIERLEALAREHDLVIVAAGRAELWKLFERDEARSVYSAPQRRLAMAMVKGARLGFDGIPFLPVKFNFFAPIGEAFWVPYHHKDVGPSWCVLFEARPGGPMDRFGDAKSGEEVVELGKKVIGELMPWDAAWAKDMELADVRGWLVGAVTPTVRRPFATLPSGRVIAGVGDTIMSLDPIAGQGANNGMKMARNLVSAIARRGDRPFDAEFLTETFETFYQRHGEITYRFNNLFLEPIPAPARELLIAQYGANGLGDDGRQKIANAFIENFADPNLLTPALESAEKARAIIRSHTGRSPVGAALPGVFGIAKSQLRQLVGLAPTHPIAEAPRA